MSTYEALHRRSIVEREAFWAEQAGSIHWEHPPRQILDYSTPPFRRWFAGGRTNLCFNAVDRHLDGRGDQPALIHVSTETDETRCFSFRELYAEVNRFAAVLQELGVARGDRVVIYMPMVPEAVFAMLATVRLGAVHSVVFGGFAAHNLAVRIDDARPKVLVTADAGMRGGRPVPYKHLVDAACEQARYAPDKVLIVNRGLDPAMPWCPGRDVDYGGLRAAHAGAEVAPAWLESNEPSYILYTSGTTGKPKGVQRDTGGYAVALAASMAHVYDARPGETMFTTSDIGWVVGHSYIVYGPLIHGMATIVYEGLPTRPDPGIWWRLVERYRVSTMFSSPTAIRVLKKQDPKYLEAHDLASLRYLFLAGEPLDESTARWISESLGVPVIDHYWQTETGWAMLTYLPGVDLKPLRFGSPGFPNYGFDIRVIDEATGAEAEAGKKGVLAVVPPLPPGCLSTVWGDDERCLRSYFSDFSELLYTSSDWALRDADGYYFILGRTDDVINVAGHRLGTREIEEAASAHPAVAEVAVVGVSDEVKGQEASAFVTLKDPAVAAGPGAARDLAEEIKALVVAQLGPVARPAAVYFVGALPKTRSGKLLRRSIQAVAEGRDPGDLSTLDDPASLEAVRHAVGGQGAAG